MKSLLTKMTGFLRKFMRVEPFQFAAWETIWLRIGLAWLLQDSILTEPPLYPGTPYPHGLAHFMDLGFLRDAGIVHWLSLSAMVTLVLGAIGFAEPLTWGWTLFVIIASKSYNQSQGAIGHAGQLHALCLLALWLASLRALWDGKGWRALVWAGPQSWSRQVWWIVQTIAASYTVSACTKLLSTGFTWPFRGANFLVQMLKAHNERLSSSDALPSELGQWAVQMLTSHPSMGKVFLMPAFLLEFFAFLALLNRRMSLVVGLGLLAFHNMTDLLMAIAFGTHQQLLWLFLVNPVFWAVSLGLVMKQKMAASRLLA